jgi:chromosome segregation ATPase
MSSENSLSDKNLKVLTLNNEKERLESEIEKTKEQIKNTSSQPPGKAVKVTVAGLEEQNKKLLDEYYTLKQQSTDLKNMKETLTIEYSEIKQKLRIKNKELEKVKKDSEDLVSQSKNSVIKAENELITAKNSLLELQETQKNLKNELEDVKASNFKAEQEIEENNQKLLKIQGKIAAFQQQLLKLSENESALSEKLMDYKNELAEAEMFYQKHEVLKVTDHGNFEASIVLKKNFAGVASLELEQPGYKKIVFDVWSVVDLSLVNESLNRFRLAVNTADDLIFQSNKASEIVGKMNRFISRSKQG